MLAAGSAKVSPLTNWSSEGTFMLPTPNFTSSGCAAVHCSPISAQFAGMMVKNFAAMGFWKSYSSR